MRWLRRSLWLSAWAAWLWLGVGLHHQLPRVLAQPLCRLPLAEPHILAGFVGETNRVVQVPWENDGESTRFEFYDAETGAAVGQAPGPSLANFPFHSLERHGVVVTRARPRTPRPEYGLFVLDLTTLQWRRLAEQQPLAVNVHPTRPLMANVLETPRPFGRLVVLDFETGRELFARDAPVGSVIDTRAFFIGVDRLVIPFASPVTPGAEAQLGKVHIDWKEEFGKERRLEVWNLAGTPALEKTIEKAPFTNECNPRGGRFVFPPGAAENFKVFDVLAGRVVFAAPEASTPVAGRIYRATLSPSGGRVLAGLPATLWDVETGKVLWRQREYEHGMATHEGRLRVREQWSKLWESLAGWKFETEAYRSIETGVFEFRIPARDRFLAFWNAAGTLAVADDGNGYRLPLPVNWPLLCLCQSVLALPLVLLWAGLRWWRKQRRMAPMGPASLASSLRA